MAVSASACSRGLVKEGDTMCAEWRGGTAWEAAVALLT